MAPSQQQSPAQAAPPQILASDLQKPDLDDRQYRVIQLANNLEALIVSDKDTDKASASLAVHVGSFSDSKDLPGQAHAVEHLLFMGTEKYPTENDYSQYLSEHSGSSNAYTAATETNYYFEVSSSHLYGALDRFAQFFISPLFLAESLDRELRAVDSENKKNLQQDMYRLYQLSKSLSNPDFVYNHFSTGNLQTLKEEPGKKGVDVRAEFLKFHEKYYSANGMKLVVLGRESLDTLQDWVVELFSEVKNKNLPSPKFDGEVLTEKELLTQCFAKPVMDSRSLDLAFTFMDEENLYKSHPSRYISHLIGHEGPGSILAYLKQKGWVNGLSAGANPICTGSALFNVNVNLTEEGLAHYEEILKTIFQYINLLQQTPIQEWVVKELQLMAEVDFKFMQKSPASRFTSRLSPVMHKPLPREWLLSGSLIREFDPVKIKEALSLLSPNNFKITIVSKDPVKGKVPNQKEKWYGTEYMVEKIPQELLDEIKKTVGPHAPKPDELHFPHRNEFIPSNLEVVKTEVKEPTKVPALIRNSEKMRVWFKKDDTFWVPKASLYITMRNPIVYTNPATSIRSKVFCELVKDALNEYAYDAEISGLDYHLNAQSNGFNLEIDGYNDKMTVLLEKVLTKMRDLEIRPDRFKVVKDWIRRSYKNWDYAQPYSQIREYTKYLTSERFWLNEEHLEELELLTEEDVGAFAKEVLRQLHFEILVHGNFFKEDALKVATLVEGVFKARTLPLTQFRPRRSLLIPRGGKFIYQHRLKDPENVNSCIDYTLWIGLVTDRRLRAQLNLLSQITSEPAFNQLRTKEQLGYIVFSGSQMGATIMGYRILIQSERSAPYLEGRIEAFLREFENTLVNMSDKEFANHVDSLISKKLEKVKNLTQESGRYWNYIGNEFFDFLQLDEEVKILRTITKADLESFYATYISPSSTQRSKISIHLIAEKSTLKNALPPNTLTPAQQRATLVQALAQFLLENGVKANPAVLHGWFGEEVDVRDVKQVVERVGEYLVKDWALEDEKVKAILEKGEKVLREVLPQLVGVASAEDGKKVSEAEDGEEVGRRLVRESIVIEDVEAWKRGLTVSKAAMPVRPLAEFEEGGAKL